MKTQIAVSIEIEMANEINEICKTNQLQRQELMRKLLELGLTAYKRNKKEK